MVGEILAKIDKGASLDDSAKDYNLGMSNSGRRCCYGTPPMFLGGVPYTHMQANRHTPILHPGITTYSSLYYEFPCPQNAQNKYD